MKTDIINCFILVIITFCSCAREDSDLPKIEKQIKQVVITSMDYVNLNVNESTSEFDYLYENNKIMEIVNEGKKHITFKYENENVIEKKYYNNIEEVYSIEKYFYDQQNRLILINAYNNYEDLIYSRDLIYEFNQLTNFKETFLFPTTSFQEFEFIYSGLNIDSVISSTANQIYVCEYNEDINNQNLNWFIENMGLYQTSPYGISGINLPTIFSSNSINSVRGYDYSGNQIFEFTYDHKILNDRYSELYIELYDQNQEILNSSKIEFKY